MMTSKTKSKPVSIKELSAILKLSPAAVSQALNSKPSTIRVSEKTRKRVQRAARTYGYRSNQAARVLRTGKSGMVGMIMVQSRQQICSEHLNYAGYFAREQGLVPLIQEVSSFAMEETIPQVVNVLLDARVEAAILALLPDFSLMPLFAEAEIPVFSVSMPFMDKSIPKYCPDKLMGFELIAGHLIDQGVSRITFVGGNDDRSHLLNAKEGIQRAVKAAQLRKQVVSWNIQAVNLPSYQKVEQLGKRHNIHPLHLGGYLGMKKIIKTGSRPDAVMCSNDNWAQGALRACAEEGLRVPQDVAISGFDNDSTSSAGMTPLTSAGQPIKELYRRVFADLRTTLDDNQKPARNSTILPCDLFVRTSTQRLER